MSGVLYCVVDTIREGVKMFQWEYAKETPARFSGGNGNAKPHYRTLIRKGGGGEPEKRYRRTKAEAVQAFVEHCGEQAQQCRDIESDFIVQAAAATALLVTP